MGRNFGRPKGSLPAGAVVGDRDGEPSLALPALATLARDSAGCFTPEALASLGVQRQDHSMGGVRMRLFTTPRRGPEMEPLQVALETRLGRPVEPVWVVVVVSLEGQPELVLLGKDVRFTLAHFLTLATAFLFDTDLVEPYTTIRSIDAAVRQAEAELKTW